MEFEYSERKITKKILNEKQQKKKKNKKKLKIKIWILKIQKEKSQKKFGIKTRKKKP